MSFQNLDICGECRYCAALASDDDDSLDGQEGGLARISFAALLSGG